MNTVLMIVLGLVSLVITIAVMLQSDNGEGASALGGMSMSAAKKAKGHEALLNKVTVIGAVVFVILTLVLVIIQ